MQAERMQKMLEAVLAQEVACTERLLESLQTERSALAARDTAMLARSTEEKLQYTEKLDALERERERLLAEMGFGSDSADLNQCLESLPGNAHTLNVIWQRVLANAEACRTSNLTNGGILEANRQHVEQALCILRGQAGSPSVYDPKGETAPHLGQRELGKV